ncbi:hypothetical protein [Mesorhizobium sp.]|uniref:hypothetical protein n=1 Tax=Mesorhizobium sp. TaxID=1871066 RepID=UPI00257C33FB|nr:hypothetical protein [Mesorhizobium sp.]
MDGTVDLTALQTLHNAPQDDVGADVVDTLDEAAGSIGRTSRIATSCSNRSRGDRR